MLNDLAWFRETSTEDFLAHYFVVRVVILTPGNSARSRARLMDSLAVHNRAGAHVDTWASAQDAREVHRLPTGLTKPH